MHKSSITLLIATLPFVSCGGNSSLPQGNSTGSVDSQNWTAPEEVAESFLRALQSQDDEALHAALTPAARSFFEDADEGFTFSPEDLVSFQLGESIVHGTEADVPAQLRVDGEEQDLKIKTRRGAQGWRVYGVAGEIAPGAEFTMDFEHVGDLMQGIEDELTTAFETAFDEAFADWNAGPSPEELALSRERFEALVAVDPSQGENGWQIDVRVNGRSALDALGDLLVDLGLRVDSSGCQDALATPIELELDGVSHIQAVERIAAAVDLYPIYPELSAQGFGSNAAWDSDQPAERAADASAPALRFAQGTRPRPIAFSGPFLIEIPDLQENAPRPTGEITVAVRALGLDARLLALQGRMEEHLELTSVTSARDEELRSEPDTHFWITPEFQAGYWTAELSADLRHLLRGVEELSLTGVVHLPIPVQVATVSWKGGEAGPKEVDGLRIELSEWGQQTRFSITGSSKLKGHASVQFSPLDQAGAPMAIQSESSYGYGDSLSADLMTEGAPASLDMKIVGVEKHGFPFAIENVPLQRYEEAPEGLEPLQFDGSHPVLAHFTKFLSRGEMPKFELRVDNRSNKNVTEVQASFVYLDAQGAELSDFPQTLSGDFDFDSDVSILAAPRAEVVREAVAFFCPPEARSIRVEVERVAFDDGTSWEK